MSLAINDPRSQLDVGHYFNSRLIRQVSDVVLEPAQALIYSRERQLIRESTNWPIANVLISFPWLPQYSRLKRIGSGIPLSSASYYHWLGEDLPGTIAAMKVRPDLPLLISSTAPVYVRDFINLSNRSHLVLTNPVNVDSVIVTEKHTDTGWPHPKDIETLTSFQQSHFHVNPLPNEKLYISRKFSKRSPKNESAVEELFTDFEYQVIYSEHLNLSSQIEKFARATHIGGIHGAGLSNMVWAAENTRILDIASSQYWTECFHRLASIKGQDYNYLLYDGDIGGEIDLSKLKAKLSSLE